MQHPVKIEGSQMTLHAKQTFLDEIKALPDGEYYFVLHKSEIGINPKMNRYYRGVVVKTIAEELGYRDQEEMHCILKLKFNIKTTTILSKREFWEYIQNIIQWAGEFLSIAIPEPEE